MAAVLYPQRQRCRVCRRFFGFLVVRGLYCSYRCAKMPDPPDDVEERPRECRTRNHGAPGEPLWREKRQFWSEQEAFESTSRADQSVYLCSCCGTWHLGRLSESEQKRRALCPVD